MLKRHTGYSCGSPPSRLRDHCIAGPRSLQTSKFWNWARALDSLGLARSLGAEVWQTDHLTAALEIARLNARANDVNGIRQFSADWTRWTDDRLYDVILGADILYERAMQGSVVSIFGRNLAPDGFVLLADPGRQQSIDLLARLEHEGARFDLEITHVEPTCELGSGAPVEVVLLKGEFSALRMVA